jgi:hypothetical protein
MQVPVSEFSDSFHLRTDRVDDGVALLRRADQALAELTDTLARRGR